MKRACGLILALAMLSSCDFLLGPKLDKSKVEAATGPVVRLTINESLSRTIHPDGTIAVFRYVVSGTGPSGATVNDTFTGASWVSPALARGSWSFDVIAQNAALQNIGGGQGSAVVGTEPVNLSVTVLPFGDGTGTFTISVTWPGGYPAAPNLVGRIEPRGSTVGLQAPIDFSPLDFDTTTVPGTATLISPEHLRSGSYFLTLSLYEGPQANGVLVWARSDSVLIFRGMTTTAPEPASNPTDLNRAPIVRITVPSGVLFPNTSATTTITSDPGAVILYTIDGTDPETNGIAYTGPITIADATGAPIGSLAANPLRAYTHSRFGSSTDIATYMKAPPENAVYVDAAAIGPDFFGTQTKPKRSVAAACDLIAAQNILITVYPEIRVAGGTYNGAVSLPARVTLRGGYNSTTWLTGGPTTILLNTGGGGTSSPTDPIYTLRFPPSAYGMTLEDVTIQGPTGTNDYTAGIFVNNPTVVGPELVTIRRVIADGGSGSLGSYGIFALDSRRVLIERSRMWGSGPTDAAGLRVAFTSSVPVGEFVVRNNLLGADGILAGHGAYLATNAANSNVDFFNNTVLGGTGTSGSAISLSANGAGSRLALRAYNNILIGRSATYSAFYESFSLGGIPSPAAFDYNTVLVSAGTLYHDADTPADLTTDGQLNTAGYIGSAGTNNDGAGQNPTVTAMFAGGTGLPTTAAAFMSFNWALIGSATASMQAGGTDLSGSFLTDFAGTTRTPGWSRGAYEY